MSARAAVIALLLACAATLLALWTRAGPERSGGAPVDPHSRVAEADRLSERAESIAASPVESETFAESAAPSIAPRETAPGRTLRVRVETQEGAPVEGAEVALIAQGRAARCAGATDAGGEIDVDVGGATALDARIVATRAGFAPASRAVPDEARGLTLVLSPSAELAGTLTYGRRRLALAGLRVLAVDVSSPRDEARRVLDDADPELAFLGATTDAAGRFAIPGMDPDRAYRLHAGGKGFFAREAPRVSRERPAAFELPVERLFGARLRFVDEEGAEIAFPPAIQRAHWRRQIQVETDERGPMYVVAAEAPYIELSGLDANLSDGVLPSFGLLLASSGDPDAAFGQVTDRGRPLGYSDYAVTYELPPIARGLADVRIALRSSADGFGSVLVRFVDAASGAALPQHLAPWPGFLHVTLTGEGAPIDRRASEFGMLDPRSSLVGLSIDLRLDGAGEALLEGLPFGRYLVHYRSHLGPYAHPPPRAPSPSFTIGPLPALLELPLEAAGALELSLVDARGDPYRGTVQMALGTREPARDTSPGRSDGKSDSLSFRTMGTMSSPPYLVRGIPAGTWTLFVASPRIAAGPGPPPWDVEVEAGRVVRVHGTLAQTQGR